MKTIGEIKTEFLNTGYTGWQELCDVYRSDERAGVTKLVQQYEKRSRIWKTKNFVCTR